MTSWKTVILAIGFAFVAPQAWATEAISKAAGCNQCHAKDKKLLAPSYKDMAAKYKGDATAPEKLAERVRNGSKGVWGPAPMPPTDPAVLNDRDLKTVVAWILKR